MAVNFPQSPQPGDEFISGGIVFVFEDNRWVGAVTNNTLNTIVGATGPEGPEGPGIVGVDTTALSGFNNVEISGALGVGADAPSDAKVEIVNPELGNFSDQPVLRVVQNELGEENLIQEWEAKNSNPFRVFSNSGNDYGIGVYGLDNDDSQEQAYSIYNGSGSSGVEFICGTGTFTNDWKKFRITQFGNYDKFGNMRAYPSDIRSAEFTPGFYETGRLFRITNVTDVNIGYDGSQEGGSFVKIVNESGSNINIVQSPGNTMYLTSDGSTGSRVLANRGLATIYNVAGSTFYIEGGGIT